MAAIIAAASASARRVTISGARADYSRPGGRRRAGGEIGSSAWYSQVAMATARENRKRVPRGERTSTASERSRGPRERSILAAASFASTPRATTAAPLSPRGPCARARAAPSAHRGAHMRRKIEAAMLPAFFAGASRVGDASEKSPARAPEPRRALPRPSRGGEDSQPREPAPDLCNGALLLTVNV